MQWTVTAKRTVEKQVEKLPPKVKKLLARLLAEISSYGPVRGNWNNYSSLGSNIHHCHLKKGHPTYVAVWEVINKEIRLIEVSYVGTHEKAPY
jgi:mRNA-degrading endonuclease RelE of RelBE toxin-antitoxin system